ncbi:unnamed protein product [Mytilus coruscus]|uniref:Uncharacterized protein n=1 Tax=Mytilus coruscus TaxID=42192 RepID=A0A6J8EX37_MYTCO|nr:unnamed protein product [Mytilus coruscus]
MNSETVQLSLHRSESELSVYDEVGQYTERDERRLVSSACFLSTQSLPALCAHARSTGPSSKCSSSSSNIYEGRGALPGPPLPPRRRGTKESQQGLGTKNDGQDIVKFNLHNEGNSDDDETHYNLEGYRSLCNFPSGESKKSYDQLALPGIYTDAASEPTVVPRKEIKESICDNIRNVPRKNSSVKTSSHLIPPELLERNHKAVEIYKECLKLGKDRLNKVRIIVVGPKKSGKTCLVRRLLRKGFENVNSTNGVEIHASKCKANLGDRKWIGQEESSIEEDVNSRLLKSIIDTYKEIEDTEVGNTDEHDKNKENTDDHISEDVLSSILKPTNGSQRMIQLMQPVHMMVKALNDLKCWLETIRCYGAYHSIDGDKSQKKPSVFIVGTHKDTFKGSLQKCMHNLKTEVKKAVENEETRKHVRNYYLVSNTDDTDEDFEQMREQLLVTAQTTTCWNKTEILEIAANTNQPMSGPDEVEAFLVYHHGIGTYIYFKNLPDYVVLFPQWLANAFRCIVFSDIFQDDASVIAKWKQFRTTGRLSANYCVPSSALADCVGMEDIDKFQEETQYFCKMHSGFHCTNDMSFDWIGTTLKQTLTKEQKNASRMSMITRGVLTDALYDRLAMDSTPVRSRTECDITYLYTELRRHNRHMPTKGSLGVSLTEISEKDKKIGDDIERIRLIRQEIQDLSSFEIDDSRFKELCRLVRYVAKRMELNNNKSTNYTNGIRDIFQQDISHTQFEEQKKGIMQDGVYRVFVCRKGVKSTLRGFLIICCLWIAAEA